MTDAIFVARALSLAFGVIAFSLIIQFVVRPALVDSLRQRIFAIRRKAFFLVADGRVQATDPEYVATDMYLSGLLRFAERFTFTRLITSMTIYDYHNRDRNMALFKMPVSDDTNVSLALRRIRTQATERLLVHIFETSPLAWMAVLLSLPFLIVRRHVRRMRELIVRTLTKIFPQKNIEREVAAMITSDDAACSSELEAIAV